MKVDPCLTPRQIEVLGVSRCTADWHLHVVFGKLGVGNRVAAIRKMERTPLARAY